MKRQYVKQYQGMQAETTVISFTASTMIHRDRVSRQSCSKAHFPIFLPIQGAKISECPFGWQNGSSIKSEVFQSFLISQSNSICVILEEKGKEVTKRQLYSPTKKVWERWRDSQKYIQMYHVTKQIWWRTWQDVAFQAV